MEERYNKKATIITTMTSKLLPVASSGSALVPPDTVITQIECG
jgi:hypothetical protein